MNKLPHHSNSFNPTYYDGESVTSNYITKGSLITPIEESLNSSSNNTINVRLVDVAPDVAKEEEKLVFRSRGLVGVVLTTVVIAMLIVGHFVCENLERIQFKSQFDNYANQIMTVSKENVQNTFGSIEAFGVQIAATADNTNQRWPFVTVPHFPTLSNQFKDLAKADSLIMAVIVEENERAMWNKYSKSMMPVMYQDYIDYYKTNITVAEAMNKSIPYVWSLSDDYRTPTLSPPGLALVLWHTESFISSPLAYTNVNFVSPRKNSEFTGVFRAVQKTLSPVIEMQFEADESQATGSKSQIMFPLFEKGYSSSNDKKLVACLWIDVDWATYFRNVLGEDAGVNAPIDVVVESKCNNRSLTFSVEGLEAKLKGMGNLHEHQYEDMVVKGNFFTYNVEGESLDDSCLPELNLLVYPTEEFEEQFQLQYSLYVALIIFIFALTSFVFFVYDWMVRRRQSKVMERVIRQHKIVSNMLPAKIRDQLLHIDDRGVDENDDSKSLSHSIDGYEKTIFGAAPLAELYPSATVVFADINGFTKWSSTREPPQVFKLLECIFNRWDKLAYRYGVFKIETVGDCYVAVAGLPDAREDHVVAVAKFARDVISEMGMITRKLEMSLGPDTSDLGVRIGIHSGQVTAGLLRGDKTRYQLFGDTVNTASRMQTTGLKNCIQVSEASAELLRLLGKANWVKKRKDLVEIKGKGCLQTYWMQTKAKRASCTEKRKSSGSHTKATMGTIDELDISHEDKADEISIGESGIEDFDDHFHGSSRISLTGRDGLDLTKTERLIRWNVAILGDLLRQILAARETSVIPSNEALLDKVENDVGTHGTVLEEFKEIISLPKVSVDALRKRKDPKNINLPSKVEEQLQDFLLEIAKMYRENHFHNFEHATHVTASVTKLLSRIVRIDNCNKETELNDIVGHSYGITSDPLTQFAVVLSAIIHDVDHPGVPNAQLVKEKTRIASYYKEQSIAEQNSVDLSWKLLMSPKYRDLRACIYSNEEEFRRFRQLIVNIVMATDITDKQLGALRKARWGVAFSDEPIDTNPNLDMNRKATIVLEHLIQASDVCHMMQHFEVYRDWNERFFFEVYAAYEAGRGDKNPIDGWYQGEIGFYDFYVIPLAKKLDKCGVFGVSSHEYLDYAEANRNEWIRKGKGIVQDYVKKYTKNNASNQEQEQAPGYSMSTGENLLNLV